MNTPTLVDMLKAGVHFGHKKSSWHPNMEPYIFTTKNNVHILDLHQTEEKLKEAMEFAKKLASEGKQILFVGTKKTAATYVRQAAEACGMPFMTHRWLGGTLTNFQTISTVARKLTTLKKQQETGDLDKYTKKEQLDITREIERLQTLVGGIEEMSQLPAALFIVDLKEESTALNEAKQLGIPVIALCDSNCDPRSVEIAVPANDDAVKSVELLSNAMADAVAEGVKNPVKKEEPKKEKKK